MAINYYVEAICDKCGVTIEPLTIFKSTSFEKNKKAKGWTLWDWKEKWKNSGVMMGLANRAGKLKLYCPKCAGS